MDVLLVAAIFFLVTLSDRPVSEWDREKMGQEALSSKARISNFPIFFLLGHLGFWVGRF